MSRKSLTKSSTNSNNKLQVTTCKKQDFLTEDITFFNKFDYVIMFIIALVGLIYILRYIDSISWQLSSIGRIILIRLLPYYDWRHLKNQQCLIDSWKEKHIESISFNCDVCENMDSIDVYRALDEDILEERYINLDSPVILTSGLNAWPTNSSFIEELKLDKDFSSSQPCKLSTNTFNKGYGSAGELLERTQHFDKFFLLFQNCDLEAMRVLRRYCYRPDIVPPQFSPTVHNWLVWNKNYNMTFYKPVDLVENLAIFGQLFGSSNIRLIPRKNCENVCPFLNIELTGGEMLVFSDLWDLEYRTVENGENMAVIIEFKG